MKAQKGLETRLKKLLMGWLKIQKIQNIYPLLNRSKNAIEKKEGEPAAAFQEMKTKEKELEKFIF